MNCRILRRGRPNSRPPVSAAAATIADQLRAQIPHSTDPERLERLAREAEGELGLRRPIRRRRRFLFRGLGLVDCRWATSSD